MALEFYYGVHDSPPVFHMMNLARPPSHLRPNMIDCIIILKAMPRPS